MSRATLRVQVSRKTLEAKDICTYELVNAAGGELPAFEAGAHIDVYMTRGLVRQYSLCNAPHERERYLIGVLRDPQSRGGSAHMHDKLAEGDVIEIGNPRNHFPLASDRSHSILLAGGIGVTPILCMAERLAMTDRSFEMHYCTRSEERTAFRKRIAEGSFREKVHYHFDDGDAAQKLDIGKVLGNPSADVQLYMCGPAGFINYVVEAARRCGWPESQIHLEYFSFRAPVDESDGSFDVKLARSGKVVRIAPETSILQALAAADVTVETSCEQGFCGTCLTRVIEGEPDHRDDFLTDAERAANDQMLLCCSRSKSATLVLDL
jgi:vanillate monooxygenase ferredoxin subunit